MSEPECVVTITYDGPDRHWRWYLKPSPVPSFSYKYMGFSFTRRGAEWAGKRAARKVVRDLKNSRKGTMVVR